MKIALIDHAKSYQPEHSSPSGPVVYPVVELYKKMSGSDEYRIYIIQRAAENLEIKQDNITRIFIRDQFGENLKWCENPEEINQVAGSLAPDIVHMFNLGLPLHFRWLRNHVPPKTKLVGHHTGEHIWIQMRLFLQQFGLRASDAFVFEDLNDAAPWLTAAVILPNQSVFEIPNGNVSADYKTSALKKIHAQIMDL